jgi:hypothetical protein
MPRIRMLFYECKAALGMTALLPLPALAGFALLEWIFMRNAQPQEILAIVMRDFCLLLPVSVGLAAAHLMTFDLEEGFAEMRATYVEPSFVQVLRRTLLAFGSAGVAFGMGWLAYSVLLKRPLPMDLVGQVWVPAAFFIGLALLTNRLSGSYWVSTGIVVAVWFLEILPQTRGRWLGGLALFAPAWPGTLDLPTNQLLLVGLALLMLCLNLFLKQRIVDDRGPRIHFFAH